MYQCTTGPKMEGGNQVKYLGPTIRRVKENYLLHGLYAVGRQDSKLQMDLKQDLDLGHAFFFFLLVRFSRDQNLYWTIKFEIFCWHRAL